MTLSALGIFSAAGAGGDVGTYELISTSIVSGSSTGTITFSNLGALSSTYRHLQIRMTGRLDVVRDGLYLRFNGDTGNNYRNHELTGNGSSVYSGANGSPVNYILASRVPYSGLTANVFSAAVVDILDAYSTTKNTTVRSLNGFVVGPSYISLMSGAWFNTASITSIDLVAELPNFVAGSRFSLYGIRG